MTAAEEKLTEDARVVAVRELGGDGYVLRLGCAHAFREPLEGGHFFMLRTLDLDFPFLNRPFSIHAAAPDGRGSSFDFMFKVVGPGTGSLSRVQPGAVVRMIGPLGRAFPYGDSRKTTVMVAGGVGLPPLNFYLQRMAEQNRQERVILLYGARSLEYLYDLETLARFDVTLKTATEDGTHGRKGRVDVLLKKTLAELDLTKVRVLTCGPESMMERVAQIAAESGVECTVSLETMMACGFGVCNACAVKVRQSDAPGYRWARSCLEGPVMDAAELLWT